MLRLLALIAALAGNPLRHAEAADDLARSLAAPVASHALDEKDGGVGDDSGSSILRAGAHVDAACPTLDAIRPGPFEVDGRNTASLEAQGPGALSTNARRHARLQRFRF